MLCHWEADYLLLKREAQLKRASPSDIARNSEVRSLIAGTWFEENGVSNDTRQKPGPTNLWTANLWILGASTE
jgi:hypothetical protein